MVAAGDSRDILNKFSKMPIYGRQISLPGQAVHKQDLLYSVQLCNDACIFRRSVTKQVTLSTSQVTILLLKCIFLT